VLLSLGVVFSINTILPKIWALFYVFIGSHFRNSGSINKWADIQLEVLKDLIKHTVETYRKLYPTES